MSSSEDEATRLIGNAAYEAIYQACDDTVIETHKKQLRDNIARLMADDKYLVQHLFRFKDSYTKSNSVAIDIIEETVNQNKELLQHKTIETLHNYIDDTFIYKEAGKYVEEALNQQIDGLSSVWQMVYDRNKALKENNG